MPEITNWPQAAVEIAKYATFAAMMIGCAWAMYRGEK